MSESARPGGIYQTLDEQWGRLFLAEKQYERAWQTPGLFLGGVTSSVSFSGERLNEGAARFLAAALLFLLPMSWPGRRFTLTWNEAVRIGSRISLLFGASIILGKLLSDTGLAENIGNGVTNALGVTSPVGITLLATVMTILISQTTGNTASAGVIVPVVIPHHQLCWGGAPDPSPGSGLRRFLRVHAFGLHTPEHHRLRLRGRSDHHDGPLERRLRRRRRRPDLNR